MTFLERCRVAILNLFGWPAEISWSDIYDTALAIIARDISQHGASAAERRSFLEIIVYASDSTSEADLHNYMTKPTQNSLYTPQSEVWGSYNLDGALDIDEFHSSTASNSGSQATEDDQAPSNVDRPPTSQAPPNIPN